MPNQPTLIELAISHLKAGHVIAYPTEAVYGLGCDPFNQEAVARIAHIKGRAMTKGFILIAASWDQIKDLTLPIDPNRLNEILATWPGPYTWVFPASSKAPAWITGSQASIAVRITAHPVAKALCEAYGKPIVSTSANLSNQAPIKELAQLQHTFGKQIDYILPGKLGTLTQPTSIRDAITLQLVREST